MVNITNLTQKKNELIANATELVTSGLNSAEQKEQHRQFIAEIDATQDHIDLLSKLERLTPPPGPVAAPSPVTVTVNPENRKARMNAAFRDLLKRGYAPHSSEQRDLLTSNGGAVLIPQEFEPAYTNALKFYRPIATLVKVDKDSTGRQHKFSVSDDTAATMTYVPEDTTTSGIEADPVLRSQIQGTDSLATVVKFSLQMLEDAFSLEAFIRDIAGIRVARSVEYALTRGLDNGSNTALPNSPTGGLLGSVTQGASTSTLAGGIGYSDLVNLAGSVDHAYYVNGVYMASPSVHNYFLGQKDSTGRPFYNIDPVTGLMQIGGKPLYVNNAMPLYNAASSPVVLFGDFSRAYVYQNGGGMQIKVLSERYIDTFEGAAVIYHRIGAAPLVSGAVKSLVTAAS